MVRQGKGLKLQSLVRERLRKLASGLNLEMYNQTKEYPYNYKRIISNFKGRNPSCDIAISDNENLFLVEIDSQGTPTFNAVKVWFYIKNGGCFYEWKEPKRVYLLHYVSEKIRVYDFSIAKDLRLEINELAKKQGIFFQYENFERFELAQRGIESVAKELSRKIIDKVKELREIKKTA